MRLYLAVAVLMLAFVAYTEAQDETFQQKMDRYLGMAREYVNSVSAQVNDHEFVQQARAAGEKAVEWVKTKAQEAMQ